MSHLTGADRYMVERASEFTTAVAMYYKYLHLMGQTENCDPYRLLMTMHIHEIFTGKLSGFVDAQDYRLMDKVLRSISGAGLLPYHVWRTQMAQVHSATSGKKPVAAILNDILSHVPIQEGDVETLTRILKDSLPDYNDFIIEAGTSKTL